MTAMAATAETNEPAPRAAVPTVSGYVDTITAGRAFGWAWDAEHPSARIAIRLESEGTVVSEGLADRLRVDLKSNGIGDGAHAFEFALPDGVPADGVRVVALCPASGQAIELAPRAAGPMPESGGNPDDLRDMVRMLYRWQRQLQQNLESLNGTVAELCCDAAKAPASATAEQTQVLARHLETLEAAQLRLDAALRQQTGITEALQRAAQDRLARVLAGAAALFAAAAFMVALLM